MKRAISAFFVVAAVAATTFGQQTWDRSVMMSQQYELRDGTNIISSNLLATVGQDLSGVPSNSVVVGLQGSAIPVPSGTNTAYVWDGSQWLVQVVDVGATNVPWGVIVGSITNQTDLWAQLTNRYTKAEADALLDLKVDITGGVATNLALNGATESVTATQTTQVVNWQTMTNHTTALSNALTVAYVAADTALSNALTTAYIAADTSLSNSLVAQIALKVDITGGVATNLAMNGAVESVTATQTTQVVNWQTMTNHIAGIGYLTTNSSPTMADSTVWTFDKGRIRQEVVEVITNDVDLTLSDAGKCYVVNGTVDILVRLPTNCTASTVGSDFRFVNVTTNLLIIDAYDSDYIDDSDLGAQIYSGVSGTNDWPWSSVTLKQADSNWWHVLAARGDWTTTGTNASPVPSGSLPVNYDQMVSYVAGQGYLTTNSSPTMAAGTTWAFALASVTNNATAGTDIVNWQTMTNHIASGINYHVVPAASNLYNLGSPAFPWANLYLESSTLYLGANGLSVSNGQIVVQDGTNTPIDYASKNWVTSQGYLTVESDPIWSAVSNLYAKTNWVTSLGYLTVESDPIWGAVSNQYVSTNDTDVTVAGWRFQKQLNSSYLYGPPNAAGAAIIAEADGTYVMHWADSIRELCSTNGAGDVAASFADVFRVGGVGGTNLAVYAELTNHTGRIVSLEGAGYLTTNSSPTMAVGTQWTLALADVTNNASSGTDIVNWQTMTNHLVEYVSTNDTASIFAGWKFKVLGGQSYLKPKAGQADGYIQDPGETYVYHWTDTLREFLDTNGSVNATHTDVFRVGPDGGTNLAVYAELTNHTAQIAALQGDASGIVGITNQTTYTSPSSFTAITNWLTSGPSDNVTLTSTGMIAQVAGTYEIDGTISHSGSTGTTHEYQLQKNGAEILFGTQPRKLGSTDIGAVPVGTQCSLAIGDVVNLAIKASSGNVVLEKANIRMVRIGD